MKALLACPFCRELFDSCSSVHCPDCEVVRLVPLSRLPPTHAELECQAAQWEATPREYRRLSWTHWGHGRGCLVLATFALAGLFFAPWVELSKPEILSLSALDLATSRAGWLWSGFAAAMTSIAVIATRRTLAGMRGVRVLLVTLASITLLEVTTLLALPPSRDRLLPVAFEYQWGAYASLLVALFSAGLATQFGMGRRRAETSSPGRVPVSEAAAHFE